MADIDGNEVTTVSIEDAILNDIGEGDESVEDTSQDEATITTTKDTSTETSAASSKQSTTGSDEEQQRKDSRGPQDLVDKDGNVVAAGGKERRFYETAQREKLRADNAESGLQQAQAQLEAVEKAGTVGTQFGLTPDETVTGAQLIAAYKENPVETIKYMLTQAQANGYNIEEIASTGLDMRAVQQMLDEKLSPLIQDRQEHIDTQKIRQEAEQVYNNFITVHPDASIHEGAISRLLENDKSLSLEAAYYKLQNYYLTKGYDWTKSLEQIYNEEQSKEALSVNTPPQPPEGGINTGNVTDTPLVADVNTSTDDIIRESMKEAGIT